MTSVDEICAGTLVRQDGVILDARSTSTLVRSAGLLIVVDTSSPSNRQAVVDGLKRLSVDPGDVDIVISTHLHGDHIGNDDLFDGAEFFVRAEESPGDRNAVTEDRSITSDVRLIHTPGHTLGSMSVMVRMAGGTLIIAGDAVPTKENHDRQVPPGIHCDRARAEASMKLIASWADVIVPGHGRAFINERRGPKYV